MQSSVNPRVFVSHATEDKERFVLAFAKRLRNAGIDAWLDKWEIQLGDSLVDKVFEEGLKDASAVIIVLSKISVNKPWVKEELNASFVAKMQKGTKLIPIIIDDCEVPESLKSTAWERVSDLTNYEESMVKIVNAVFGQSVKPTLGKPPVFVSKVFSSLNQVDDIEPIDNYILKKSCEFMLENPNSLIEPHKLFCDEEKESLPKEDILDSIKVLESDGYLKVTRFMGGTNWGCHYRPTMYGFQAYAEHYIDDFGPLIDRISAALVNGESDTNEGLSSALEMPLYLVEHILQFLENSELLELTNYSSGLVRAYSLSPKLKRAVS